MRCFLAISCSSSVRDFLNKQNKDLASELGDLSTVSWTKPQNMHLTLRFLGELSAGTLPVLTRDLAAQLAECYEFQMKYCSLGIFGNLHQPRVLWVGVSEPSQQLYTLTQSLEKTVKPYTKEASARYMPHITLARFKSRLDTNMARRLGLLLEEHKEKSFGTQFVNQIELLQSIFSPQGVSYKPLATFSLRKKYVRLPCEVKTESA